MKTAENQAVETACSARPLRLRIALLRSEGRRLALRAAREPEGCAERDGQLRRVEPDRQNLATYPKP